MGVASEGGVTPRVEVKYRRVDHKATPTNEAQRREIVRLRDVEKLSWRKIAGQLNISFQRVCQIYDRVKEQSGQVKPVRNKEVIAGLKTGRGRAKTVKTKELTPDAIDKLIDLEDKKPKISVPKKAEQK